VGVGGDLVCGVWVGVCGRLQAFGEGLWYFGEWRLGVVCGCVRGGVIVGVGLGW